MKRLSRLLFAITMVGALCALAPVASAQGSGGVVDEIVVDGAQRIEPGTVRSYLLIKEGETAVIEF